MYFINPVDSMLAICVHFCALITTDITKLEKALLDTTVSGVTQDTWHLSSVTYVSCLVYQNGDKRCVPHLFPHCFGHYICHRLIQVILNFAGGANENSGRIQMTAQRAVIPCQKIQKLQETQTAQLAEDQLLCQVVKFSNWPSFAGVPHNLDIGGLTLSDL